MIRFEHLHVYGIKEALRGMRNPMESWHKNDTTIDQNGNVIIGPNDLKLAKQLSKAGSDHGKYLRQIFVSVDIIAPLYFWAELDTYKVGTVANSTSKMHKLGSRYVTVDDFSLEDVPEEEAEVLVDLVNRHINYWIESGKKKGTKEWRALQQVVPSSYMYRRTWTANYQVLKNIANSDRRNHRLTEWHEFIDFFVENAPYFKELCVEEQPYASEV